MRSATFWFTRWSSANRTRGPPGPARWSQRAERFGAIDCACGLHLPMSHLLRENEAIRGIVVDDQHGQTAQVGRRRVGQTHRLTRREAGREPERAAPPELALHADFAAHH